MDSSMLARNDISVARNVVVSETAYGNSEY